MAQEAVFAGVADEDAVPDLEVLDRPEFRIARRMVLVVVEKPLPTGGRFAAVGERRRIAEEPLAIDPVGHRDLFEQAGLERTAVDRLGQWKCEQGLAVEDADGSLGDGDAENDGDNDQQRTAEW